MDTVATRTDDQRAVDASSFEDDLRFARRLAAEGELDQALAVWTSLRHSFPDRRQPYTDAATRLRQIGRMEDAEAWLAAGLPYFSDDVGFGLERSWLAFHRRDLPEAIRRWTDLSVRFPNHPAWCVGLAVSLRDYGRVDAANALLAGARQRFPAELSIFVEYAWLAHRQRNWPEASSRWEDVRHNFPNQSVGYTGSATSLREAGQTAAAETLLSESVIRLPNEISIAVEFAQLAYHRQDWPEARARWQRVREQFPHLRDGYLLGARTLQAAGDQVQSIALLSEAQRRWPDSRDVLDTSAHMAFERGDRGEAIRLGKEMIRLFPADAIGTFHLARALRDSGRGREAEELLGDDAPTRFAQEEAILSIWASLPMLRSDWPEAIGRWGMLRQRSPSEPKYVWQSANALWRMSRDSEADTLLDEASARFSASAMVQSMWIEAAMRRSDWSTAVERAATVRQRLPTLAAGYILGAKALRQIGREDLADQMWNDVRERLPQDPQVWRAAADEAVTRRDWPAAEKVWAELRKAQPDDIAGYLGGVTALREGGQQAQAEALLQETLSRFPTNVAAHALFATLAQQRHDYDEAIRRWESLRRQHPESESGYLGGARALQEAGRETEADALMQAAVERLPGDPDVAIQFAKFAASRADHAAAVIRFRSAMERFPWRSDAALGLVEALFETERMTEAETVLASVLEQFPDDRAVLTAHASASMRRLDWTEALRRWSDLAQRFPSDLTISQKIFEVRLRLAETGPEPQTIQVNPEMVSDDTDIASLVGYFESLGGAGHGCEFGLFQREFGAEPLGLLRWADLGYELLVRALETDFEGVGEPEHTELFAPPNERPEYWTRDKRYWMAMRCFIPTDQIPYDKMFTQACRRLQYLRLKLIEDLKAGEKIFVFKCIRRSLTDAEIKQLHAAVRRYGRNTLLYVAYEDAENPNGTVRIRANGLMVGYVDRFGFSPDDRYLGPATESWAGVCRAAYKLWVSGATEQSVAPDVVVPKVTGAANALGDRILSESPGSDGPSVTINWSDDHRARLRADLARHGPELREYAFTAIQLDAASGNLPSARRRIGDVLNRFGSMYPHDGYTFESLVISAVLASQWDLVQRFVNDRFDRQWCSGVTAAPLEGNGQVIRWNIRADGTSHFVFDTAMIGRDRAWIEVAGFAKTLSLFHSYSNYSHAECGSVAVNLGDGGVAPGLAFSDSRPDYFLVPDSVFLNTGGYQSLRKETDSQLLPWAQRRPVALWRGATTGLRRGDWRTLQRVQLCMIAQTAHSLFDVGITSIVGMPPDMVAEVEAAKIERPFVQPADFMRCKYQIDIDGNTNAWAGLFQKLYTGSPVLKIASPFGFRQWFYDDLKPWWNYVPVEADMGDLIEKVEWLREHDEQACLIGERGRALASEMTYTSELVRSRATISAAIRHFAGQPEVLLRFDGDDADAGSLLEGWSRVEDGGRRAFGPEARLRLPRPRAPGELSLRLTVAPGSEEVTGQRLTIVADGHVVHQCRILTAGTVECLIPPRTSFCHDAITVTLLLPDTETGESACREPHARSLYFRELLLGVAGI